MSEGCRYQLYHNLLEMQILQELKETAGDAQDACSMEVMICREMPKATARSSDC